MGVLGAAKEPPTLRTDLARILQDPTTHEKLCDVRLKSAIDGKEVPAVRAILGARSAPLLVLLRGGFAEGNSEVVKMQLRGATLLALVKYCYTDSFDITRIGPDVAEYIELLAAANMYELEVLSSMVRNGVTRVLDSNPSLAGSYLQALVSTPNAKETDDGGLLLRHVQRHIYRDMFGCLIACEETGVFCLGLEALELVLSDKCVQWVKTDLFHLLKRWTDHADNRKLLSTDASSDLRRHIPLELLRPSVLRDIVAPTGLFDQPHLAAAYEKIALTAEAMATPQKFLNVTNAQKLCELKRLCGNSSPKYRTLVFVGHEEAVAYVMPHIATNSCSFITQSSNAEKKNAALNRLRNETGHILVTTYDEAVKLDVPQVDFVINYHLPTDVLDYIRGLKYMVYAGGGGAGAAISFVNNGIEAYTIRNLGELFQQHGKDMPAWLTNPSDLVACGADLSHPEIAKYLLVQSIIYEATKRP